LACGAIQFYWKEEAMQYNNKKKYIAEALATFILVFCGTGAMTINEITHGAITHVGVAMTWGLIVMAMIYSLGTISGAHMNPAVTIAFAFNKSFPKKQVLPYIIGQLVGALMASIVLKLLFPQSEFLGATLPSGSALQSLVLEFILTFILMFVILQVATGSKEQGIFAGMAIGSVVLLEAMFAGPICGASMNPARSIAPALIRGHIEHLWLYIVAPVSGALTAVLIYNYLKR
jgi:aquaporin NIP